MHCSVRCWAFEPPGGLMTRPVSRALQSICVSTATAKDLIPRLTIDTLERLRDDMVSPIPSIQLLRLSLFSHWERLQYACTALMHCCALIRKVEAAVRCRVSKFNFIASSMLLRRRWAEESLFYPMEQVLYPSSISLRKAHTVWDAPHHLIANALAA
jgi:hypothetical protein